MHIHRLITHNDAKAAFHLRGCYPAEKEPTDSPESKKIYECIKKIR